jgi:hypothetical protein
MGRAGVTSHTFPTIKTESSTTATSAEPYQHKDADMSLNDPEMQQPQ